MRERQKNAVLTITTKQTGTDVEDSITLTCPAIQYEKDGCRYLFYDEFDTDTGEKTRTSMRIRSDRVFLSRKGMMNADMTFLVGERTESEYRNPFGTYPLTVDTKSIAWSKREESSFLHLVYDLALSGTIPYRYELSMEIRDIALSERNE